MRLIRWFAMLGTLAGILVLPASAHAYPYETELVSRASGRLGPIADHQSTLTCRCNAVSRDGRYVLMQSYAHNFSNDDADWEREVYVRDRLLHRTEPVSIGPDGKLAAGSHATISDDGRFVAFDSDNFFVLHKSQQQVYVHDRLTGITELVSREDGLLGSAGEEGSFNPTISADGRFVGFGSLSNLSHDTNLDPKYGLEHGAFIRDRLLGTTTNVARADGRNGAIPNIAIVTDISANGRIAVFETHSHFISDEDTDYVDPWPDTPIPDVFVRDTWTDTTTFVSRADGADGVPGNQGGQDGRISADGRSVVFWSRSTNLHATSMFMNTGNLFLRDLAANTTKLVSRLDGVDGVYHEAASTSGPSISDDGRYIAFSAWSRTLSEDDNATGAEVFVRDMLMNDTEIVSRASGPEGARADADVGGAVLSGDGRFVAFQTWAHNLTPEQNPYLDVFIRDLGHPATLDLPFLTAVAASAPEGGTLTFDLVLSAPLAVDLVVPYASALGNSSVTIPAGETSAVVSLTVPDDAVHEVAEEVQLRLWNASEDVTQGGVVATGAVIDDDPPPVLRVSNAMITEASGYNSTLSFTVQKLGATATQTSVTAQVYRATAKWDDFVAHRERLTFAPAEMTKTFAVEVIGDRRREPFELLFVALTEPDHSTIARQFGFGGIINDD